MSGAIAVLCRSRARKYYEWKAQEKTTDYDGKIKAAMCAAVGGAGRDCRTATWHEVHLQSPVFVCAQSGGIPGASAHRVKQRHGA